MTVCFFGNYLAKYPRIEILKKGLQENKVDVIEVNTRKKGFKKFFELYKKHRQVRKKYDYLLVGMGGYTLVWFAKLISKKPIIFDAFVSQYLTNIEDRKKCAPQSLKARYYALVDKCGCTFADKVLLDTNAQIEYFTKKYKLPRKKFHRVLIGADNNVYNPNLKSEISNLKFTIHWHGYIVPFHGVGTIIRAAHILKEEKDITFRIVTRFDSKFERIKELCESTGITNIEFIPESPSEKVAEYIRESDVCLGIFGKNKKATLVIPNKIYEAAASAKPVITANHKVIEEVFTEDKDILLVEPENAEGLAKKIIDLKNSIEKRKKIGESAQEAFSQKCTPKEIGKSLYETILHNKF